MSDAQKPHAPSPARETGSSPLPSARDVAVPPPAARASSPRGRRGHRERGRGDAAQRLKPTPARDLGRGEPAPSIEPDVSEAVVVTEGGSWTARVLGRAGGGRSTPLLLLGFTPCEASAGGRREALVVGRALGALSGRDLEAALRSSRPVAESEAEAGGQRP